VKPTLSRPPSAVSSHTGWWGVAAIAIALAAIKLGRFDSNLAVGLMLLLPMFAMLGWELTVVQPWRAPDSLVDRNFKICHPPDRNRVVRKLVGFAAVFALLATWFSLIPHYFGWLHSALNSLGFAVAGNANYRWVFRSLVYTSPIWLGLGALYVIWLDPRLRKPHDGAWHFGSLIIDRSLWKPSYRAGPTAHPTLPSKTPKQARWSDALSFILAWFIKGFFFVFLVQLLPGNIAQLQREAFDPWNSLFRLVYTITPLLFTIDIVLASIGYICTFKALNAHIRSPSKDWFGWLVALICYPPFVIIGGFKLTDFRQGGTYWDLWLTSPVLKWLWALAVLCCLLTYVWATVAFGIRFSNLTNRGTLTHGPYRLLKHPAYVSKNVYWWLIYVPWVNSLGPKQAFYCCALLLLLNGIYYLRARTEEAHLSQDPEYRAYSRWFDQSTLWQRIRAR
jgi:protein-S-isoprenylcysteine O-methyltransferase Ste14